MKTYRINLMTLTICLTTAISLAEMSIKVDEATQRYTINESGQQVLTYNFGTVPVPEGVGGKYAVARGNYVHPLYGAAGEILTEDFSKDHPHHRGIYWAWPEVTYKGETRDLHALQGLFARPVKILKQSADQNSAIITAENIWKWGDTEEIVREFATITAYPAKDGLRVIDFQFKFEALQNSITLARRQRTSYGGLNFRMSRFSDLKISRHRDSPGAYPCRAWAELSGKPPKGQNTVGIFLLQHPANPHYPGDWVSFEDLPWLQPTFPAAGMAYALKPGQPLELAFRVIIRSGDGLATPPEKLFSSYAGDMADPLLKMAGYQYGSDRTLLAAVEQAIREQPVQDRHNSEQRLLAILSAGATSSDFQCWAFRQLQLCGSEASLPLSAAFLAQNSWMQALDAIAALPGAAATATMINTLPTLPAERAAAVIQALGARKDEAALPALATRAAGGDEIVAAAAINGIGKLGTSAAAQALSELKQIPELQEQLIDARLACADALGQDPVALNIYRTIWKPGSTASAAQRSAALIALVRCSQATDDEIYSVLTSTDAQLQNGGAAAMRLLNKEMLLDLSARLDALPESARLAVVTTLGDRAIKESEKLLVFLLAHYSPELGLAAVRALREIGGQAAVRPLLKMVAAGGATGAEAKLTLTQLSGVGVFDVLAGAAASQDVKLSQIALKLIADRADPGALELMLEMASSPIVGVATAAIGVIRSNGTAAHLPALRQILLDGDNAVKPAAAAAMVLICKRTPDAPLAAMLQDAPKLTGEARTAMISALPEIGGEVALAFVSQSKDEAAVRALLNWPESSAIQPMLAVIADPTPADALNRLAGAGLLRLAKNTASVTEQSRALKTALPGVRDAKVRREIEDYLIELASVNIAKGKPVTSSHPWQDSHKPELALDGKLNTFWSCAHSPAWISVDLGAVEKLARIKVINYFGDGRYYQYVVELSSDNQSWRKVADLSDNTAPATEQGVSFKLDAVQARYVRVTMLKNSANPGMHIVELEVY
ncbi:MAG: PmoA family protein [Kiritimatiellae bacterium]|nr:PmoA family protein [Kiritimatiellia bacterium]